MPWRSLARRTSQSAHSEGCSGPVEWCRGQPRRRICEKLHQPVESLDVRLYGDIRIAEAGLILWHVSNGTAWGEQKEFHTS